MNYEVKEQMYEGKAKQVFATSDPEICNGPLQGRCHRR